MTKKTILGTLTLEQACRDADAPDAVRWAAQSLCDAVRVRMAFLRAYGSERAAHEWRSVHLAPARQTSAHCRSLLRVVPQDMRAVLLFLYETAAQAGLRGAS